MDIQFFSQQDNAFGSPTVKLVPATGYISRNGKLTLPGRSCEQAGLDPKVMHYRIGTKTGKRKVKILYLVPTESTDSAAFSLVASARGYYIPLSGLLRKYRLYYWAVQYKFTIEPFFYNGTTAYALELKELMTDDFKGDEELD